jgi:hypothetical protein
MKIYFFDTADGYAYINLPTEELDRYRPDPPRSLASRWLTPTFDYVRRDQSRSYLPKSDFPSLLSEISVISSKAAIRLRPILEACGELLPIRLSNDTDNYYLFNVTAVVNAVDMQRSKFFKLPSGAIGHCLKLVFDPAKIPSGTLFFKNTQMGPVTEIYATEAAKQPVENAGLTGYEFRLAWSDE